MLLFPAPRLVLLPGTRSPRLSPTDTEGGGDILCDFAKCAGLQTFRV